MKKDEKEILFRVDFVRTLTQSEQDDIWFHLVKTLEQNNLLWGGGGDKTHFTGGIYHKNDALFDEGKIQDVLLQWVTQASLASKIEFNIHLPE